MAVLGLDQPELASFFYSARVFACCKLSGVQDRGHIRNLEHIGHHVPGRRIAAMVGSVGRDDQFNPISLRQVLLEHLLDAWARWEPRTLAALLPDLLVSQIVVHGNEIFKLADGLRALERAILAAQ